MIADEGGETTSFSLESGHSSDAPAPGAPIPLMGLTITLAGSAPEPVQVLDGASRSLVGLAARTRLLFDARMLGGRLVGQWWRRDASGDVVAHGSLNADAVFG